MTASTMLLPGPAASISTRPPPSWPTSARRTSSAAPWARVARGGMASAGRALRQDASILEASIKPGTTKRVLRVAAPYGAGLTLFGAVVVLSAVVGNINPLLYRDIINHGVLGHDSGLVVRLALLVALIMVADAGLGLLQSYLAARIG